MTRPDPALVAALEEAAKAAFLAHWPKDKWERFTPKDPENGPSFVQEQYRNIARSAVNAWDAARAQPAPPQEGERLAKQEAQIEAVFQLNHVWEPARLFTRAEAARQIVAATYVEDLPRERLCQRTLEKAAEAEAWRAAAKWAREWSGTQEMSDFAAALEERAIRALAEG